MKMLGVLFMGLVFAAIFSRAWGLLVRHRGMSRLTGATRTRQARGVHVRARADGRTWRGLRPGRAHHTRGDLVLAGERLVLATALGVLLDVTPSRPLSAVRAPGPGRLVLEGKEGGADGKQTVFRVEVVVDAPELWARDLAALASEVTAFGPPTASARA